MKRLVMIMVFTLLVIGWPFAVAEDMVSMTVPSFDGNPVATQEGLDAAAGEWYESATLNADNSVTYVLSRKNRDEALRTILESLDSDHAKMIESSEYPNFVSIERNDDLTLFRIGVKSDSLSLNDMFASMKFIMESSFYHAMLGIVPDDVVVEYIDLGRNVKINEIKLSDMQAQ